MKTKSTLQDQYKRMQQKYRETGNRLQVMEMADGVDYMLNTPLYKDYVVLGEKLEEMRVALKSRNRGRCS
ncbi:MAG TPA: hypothetical protein VMU69_20030 [Bradyrhizobium sp.]|nr:hypothetical protein [Bradyrhizobium sp.]